MTLLITGGTGFVMSNLVRHWLERDQEARCVILDAAPWDDLAERFFATVRDRLTFIQASVLEPESWEAELDGLRITRVVHGAAVTPTREQEMAQPRRVLDVNLSGTVNLLEWTRRQPGLHRFIFVSSGVVYAADEPEGVVPEGALLRPTSLYAIGKAAGELVTQRYRELFDLDAISVRFSGVYGPMDRPTPARNRRSALCHLAHLAVLGGKISIFEADGGGDWLHACDVAAALTALLDAADVRYPVYNVAYGRFITLEELVHVIREMIPDLRWEIAAEEEAANVVAYAAQRHGRWGAYDISRLQEEFGWQPRPIQTAVRDYLEWLREQEDYRIGK